MSAFIISAILLLRENFSHFAVLAQFFSCNFSAISPRAQKLVRKGSLLIPAPISSPLTQLQPTNARQISDKKLTQVLKAKTFLNRTISAILDSPEKRYFRVDIGFQNWRKELYPGFICECQYILAPSKNMERLDIEHR